MPIIEMANTLSELMGTIPARRHVVDRDELKNCTPKNGMLELYDFMIGATVMPNRYLFEHIPLIELPDSTEVFADQLVSGRIKVDGEWWPLEVNVLNDYPDIVLGYHRYLDEEYCWSCPCYDIRCEAKTECGDCSCEECWDKCFRVWQDRYVDRFNCAFWKLPFFIQNLNG